MFVLIPAYCPDEKLLGVLSGFAERDDYDIVIVDDGSGSDCAAVFEAASSGEYGRVTVLHHDENRGKGAAIKTGLEYILSVGEENDGVVTVDADGQHLPEDALRVAEAWAAKPEALITGSRRLKGKVPLRSRMGNAITRSIFAVTTGVRVYDTQTGLRAFSVQGITKMLTIAGDRYDYEINQLLYAAKHRIPIVEVPIETVYIADNKSSLFRGFKDSWLIYKMIIVFMLSSFSSFVVDYVLLLSLAAIFRRLPSAIMTAPEEYRLPLFGHNVDTHLLALVIARAVSSFVNYLLNRKVVFKSKSWSNIFRYYLVILSLLAANYLLLSLVATDNGLPLWIAQLVVQAVLYPMSFILQRKFVFPTKQKGAE